MQRTVRHGGGCHNSSSYGLTVSLSITLYFIPFYILSSGLIVGEMLSCN